MSTPTAHSPWPQYPEIPIFLDTGDENGKRRSDRYIRVTTSIRTSSYLKPPTPSTTRSNTFPMPVNTASARPSPEIHFNSGNERKFGLGILGGPANVDKSPIKEKSDSTPNVAQRIEERLARYNSSGWSLELLSWLISAGCMAAIIAVLITLKNQRIPRWPLGLTLNAYIAILSRIASAALVLPVSESLGQLKWSWFHGESKKMWDFEIFDNASRGPWGSFLLLIRTKGKHLAALGALITIFALALEPFFQQVVDFPERWTLRGISEIPRVVRYEPRYAALFRDGQEILQPDQGIVATAQQFFYDYGTVDITAAENDTKSDIPLSCPTGNCTWETYDTLGICSMCEDVSELLSYDCRTVAVDWTRNLTGYTTEFKFQNQSVCGYFLDLKSTDEAPVLMSGYIVNEDSSTGEALLMRAIPLISNPDRMPLLGGSVNFKHIRNPITDFIVASTGDIAKRVYEKERPIAHECVLTWCVKTIKSSFHSGVYREEVTETYNTTKGAYPWETVEVDIDGQKGIATNYFQNISIRMPPDDPDGQIFGLTNETAINVIALTDEILPSYTTVDNSSAKPILRVQVPDTGEIVLRIPPSNPWLRPKHVPDHLDRFAKALTNVIRSSASKEFIEGKAYELEAYVLVRWLWLILPLGLLFFSLMFLLATIIRAFEEKDRIGIWKTSAVATLYNGLPDKMQQKISSSTWVGTPRTKAKELRIKLSPHKGWRTSGNLLSPMTPNIRRYQPPPGWI